MCEALLKAQVLENDGPKITIVSVIFNLKFRFYIIKNPIHTNACFNRAVLFDVKYCVTITTRRRDVC